MTKDRDFEVGLVRMKTRLYSIKTRFVLIALLISLVSFGLAAYISNRWVLADFQKDHEEKAILIARHIGHDLEEEMRFKHHEGIINALDFYKKYREVEELRVFNIKGEEVFAREQGPPEARLAEALRTGKMIHFHKQGHQRNVAAFIIPLENKPECQGCHGKNEALRGALSLSLSLDEMEHDIWLHRKRFLMLFGLIAVVIGAMTLLGVNRFLVRRLKPIQSGAEAIEKGDLGYRIPVDSDDEIGSLTGYVNRMAQKLQTFFRDLEDKNKQLTAQFAVISRSQKEWQETFDCITDLIGVIDRNHCLIRANKALKETFKDYFSETQDEVTSKKWGEFFRNNFHSHGADPFDLRDRTPTTQEIYHQTTGKIFEVSLFPYYCLEGEFTGSVVILKDITQKKEDEMGLIMNERLAALGQMASGIAHELNNPLATIAACNEGLLNRVEKENIGSLLFRSYLKIIEEEIERCKKITTDMLSFVRRSSHERNEVNVNDILDKTIDMVSYQGRLKEVEILKNVQRMMPKVLVNDGELMQVFLSIIVNALDAMEDRGTLTLETGTIPPVSPLEKSPLRPPLTKGGTGGFVFIKISDTGPGISSDVVNRIFDPFFTTKSEKGGTGLGLSIANKIMRDNNGKIEVESEQGKGATFKIVIPV
jgi:two-component system NtrC family sensor kinase